MNCWHNRVIAGDDPGMLDILGDQYQVTPVGSRQLIVLDAYKLGS